MCMSVYHIIYMICYTPTSEIAWEQCRNGCSLHCLFQVESWNSWLAVVVLPPHGLTQAHFLICENCAILQTSPIRFLHVYLAEGLAMFGPSWGDIFFGNGLSKRWSARRMVWNLRASQLLMRCVQWGLVQNCFVRHCWRPSWLKHRHAEPVLSSGVEDNDCSAWNEYI